MSLAQSINKENQLSTSIVKNKNKNVSLSSNNQSGKSRRALGDVRNTKQHNSLSINQKSMNYFKLNKEEQEEEEVEKKVVIDEDDEIEHGGFVYVDNFEDIMSEDNKLSRLVQDAKQVPCLPTGNKSQISVFEDKIHFEHVSNYEQMKKEQKKWNKMILKGIHVNEPKESEIDIYEGLFVPPPPSY